MGIAILLIFVLPVAFVVLAFVAIGMTGASVFRSGKRAWAEMKPYVDNLRDSAMKAQQRGNSFADRGQKLGDAWKEIQGRFAFVAEEVMDTQDNPMIRLAGMAGKLGGGKR